jgi:predicted solute-binding protein
MVADGFPAAFAEPYYRRIHYGLTPEHVAGEREFLSLQSERNAWAVSV